MHFGGWQQNAPDTRGTSKKRVLGCRGGCVPPPHLTDVIQPLDKAVFGALKASFRKKEEHWERKNNHRAPSPADFVQLWTDAYVDAVTPRNILSGFRSCAISPFDRQYFLEHCPPEHVQHQDLPACPPSPTHSTHASQNASQNCSQNSSAAPSHVSTKSDASAQCSGRAISAATRDDPRSLRLGVFVTAQDFLNKVSEKENGAAAKRAPKRRARRMDEPLRRIDSPAAKGPAKLGPRPAPKPGAEKRRRVDDPALEAAPGPEEPQSSSDEGDGAGDPFDLYVSYQSSC